MKNIKNLLLAIIGLALFAGCGDDDEFYNSKYLSLPNLIAIEHQNSFAVGDMLWVNTNFSRYQPEPNQTTPLDLFRTTGGASFSFVYGLEKKTGTDTWTQLDIQNIIEDEGDAVVNYFVIAESIYDPASQNYKFRAGIPLTQAGEYRLVFGFTEVSQLELSSNNSTSEDTFLTIQTTANNVSGGYYNFTVQ
ncbi:hypothetical protein MH928_12550 [Flavobacterium sp. WW92]|uniref:hypothetical protein n=1 Tax=unclassified Flavobacterium TaxID=196869 RepID=UPI002224E767|nr:MULTISPECIES: hypothetical protein [unclassified Flavobacterium]WDO12154.1 hypothetical protein MH928_12550 [Flavobacterium sp. WW92]